MEIDLSIELLGEWLLYVCVKLLFKNALRWLLLGRAVEVIEQIFILKNIYSGPRLHSQGMAR